MTGDSKGRVIEALGQPDLIRELKFRKPSTDRKNPPLGPDYGRPTGSAEGEQWVYALGGRNPKSIIVNFRGNLAIRVCQYLH